MTAARRSGCGRAPALTGWVLLLAGLAATGCREPGPPCGAVQGTVTVGGAAVANGVIRFFALGDGIGSDGPITAGRYEIPAERGLSRGTYRVEISALKPTGRRVPDPDAGPGDMKDEVVETIPDQYNRNSQLKIDFDPTEKRAHDFQLAVP